MVNNERTHQRRGTYKKTTTVQSQLHVLNEQSFVVFSCRYQLVPATGSGTDQIFSPKLDLEVMLSEEDSGF